MAKLKNLVIVESPGKVKTIQKYLNTTPELEKYGTWEVIASYGHVRDLDKKNMGIDIENDFKPQYIMVDNQWSSKTLKNLKTYIKDADVTWLAADLDREGEAIAWHIKEVYKPKKYKRIVFNEITRDALTHAITHPGKIDMNMVDSQQSRRVLDRLVGFSITPLLWKTFSTNITLSAGRVQSATLNIIIEKENEIRKHKSTSYYHVIGNFKIGKFEIEDAKYQVNQKIFEFKDSKSVVKFLKALTPKGYTLADVTHSVKTVKAPPPFITSTLQQTSGELRMSIKQIMAAAQVLYEAGIITYMRTDSTNLSNEAVGKLTGIVKKNYGDAFLLPGGYAVRGKAKGAQEAHEAIRPAKPNIHPDDLKLTSKIKTEHKRLYELIWKRTMGAVMASAKYYEVQVSIVNKGFTSTSSIVNAKPEDQRFMGKFKILFFEGFRAVYGDKAQTNLDIVKYTKEISDSHSSLSPVNIMGKNIWTVPPAHFSEATIVKTLESEGIGRPSTYASIMSKLFDKFYVEKKDVQGEVKEYVHYLLEPLKNNKLTEDIVERPIADEKSRLVPTEVGFQINDFMLKYFSKFIDSSFTASVEEKLDKVADGKTNYKDVMKTFYKDFSKHILQVQKDIKKRKLEAKASGETTSSSKAKIEIKTYSRDFNINGVTHTVRNARYGPVIQIKTEPTKNVKDKPKDTYISLIPYLKATKKDIENITQIDINLLTSLPRKIGTKNSQPVDLKYARYGFYLSNGKNNYTVYPQYVPSILEGNFKGLINLTESKKK
jgi:DNA topoisomerase-1